MSVPVKVRRGGRAAALRDGVVPPGGTEEALRNERGLLSCVLHDPAILGSLEVEASHFYAGKHTTIFGAMRALADRGEPPDLLLVSQELERTGALASIGGPAYLAELNELEATTANAAHYGNMVRSRAMRREVLLAAQAVAELAQEGGLTDDEVIEAARGRFEAAVATGAARGRVPVLVRAADVDPVDVRFLWKPYLPLGKLTLLEGDPSAGKTWLALSLATAVSLGAPFPAVEGLPRDVRPPADVIYLTAEDGIDDTLRPRLDRMGADVRRVHFLMGWKRGMVGGQITLQDLDVLGAALRQVRPALVVVDPVQAFLGAEVDMHRANEVRPVLTGLVKLAEEHACAVVAIRHLSKAPATKAMFRGLGSIDFTAAARSVLLAGKDPGSGDRALCHIKSSVAREGPAQGYAITDAEGCSWTGASHLTAQDLVAAEKPSRERGGSVDDAVAFLADALAAGPRPAAEVERDADGAGVSTATLKRAKGQLRVESYRSNARGQGRGRGAWMWALPGAQDPDAASYDDEH